MNDNSFLLYLKEDGKYLVFTCEGKFRNIDRIKFKDARQGLARIKLKDNNVFSCEMLKNGWSTEENFGRYLYEHNKVHWNYSVVEGVQVLWTFDNKLHALVNNVMYSNFGVLEDWMLEIFTKTKVGLSSILGCYIVDLANSSEKTSVVEDCLSVSDWDLSCEDSIFIFNGKIVLFNPFKDNCTNTGLLVGGVYVYLNVWDTRVVWSYLQGRYPDKWECIKVSDITK